MRKMTMMLAGFSLLLLTGCNAENKNAEPKAENALQSAQTDVFRVATDGAFAPLIIRKRTAHWQDLT